MSQFSFWANAYKWGWVTIDGLRKIIITESFPCGYITPEEFELITGIPYEQ